MARIAATGAPQICDRLINTVVALALQLSPMSHFVRATALLGFLLAASLLFVFCPFLTSETMTVSRSPAIVTAARESDRLPSAEDVGDGVVDLYGNDVSDAVAEYTLDAAGSLYEVHSPRTELVRLASPKT